MRSRRGEDDVTEVVEVFLNEKLISRFISRRIVTKGSVSRIYRFETRSISIHRIVVVISEGI
jgi:hypothetical protein